MTEGKLGARIKKYREQLGLSQEELAVNAGLDAGFVADIENNLVYPAIGNLIRLSRALGQRVGTFMDDQFLPDPVITRHGSVVEETASHRGAKGHYHYYPLGIGKADRHMEPMFIDVEEDEVKEMSAHEGEEFIMVISGNVLVRYGKEEHVLGPWDTVYFNSVVPHFIGAIDGPARILGVLYVPV